MTETMQIQSRSTNADVIDEVQVVEFILGEEKFAINLFDVREIVESIRIPRFRMQHHISKGSLICGGR